jgi:heptosyltransferase-2
MSNRENILIWLPSPLGDAVLCTPALRALRKKFCDQNIYFLASPTVKQLLSPNIFNDQWLETESHNSLTLARRLRRHNFSTVVLLKNSFGSALISFFAKIPQRIGYARDGRSFLLTDKIQPQRIGRGRFKPLLMVDYYLKIAEYLGCDTKDAQLQLPLEIPEKSNMPAKIQKLLSSDAPLVILVPGGTFGPSKCWHAERFARVADHLIEKYNLNVIISIAPNQIEQNIAKQIIRFATHTVHSTLDTPLSITQLKTIFAQADLVITNDTGPRHIAIALKRKLITLFGPNNPQWTETGYRDEIKIIGTAPCVPCDKPKCKQLDHTCMNSITVETVCSAADKILAGGAP